jgi:hypothetical protein
MIEAHRTSTDSKGRAVYELRDEHDTFIAIVAIGGRHAGVSIYSAIEADVLEHELPLDRGYEAWKEWIRDHRCCCK